MNIKILLVLALTSSVTYAHQIDGLASVHFNIKAASHAEESIMYDLSRGIVHATEPDGSTRRIGRAHMARTAPWNAEQIFGKITINVANELAGTWYIYR